VFQCVPMCRNVLQCVADAAQLTVQMTICQNGSILQCVEVCCSVLQCVAVCHFVGTDVLRCAGLLTMCCGVLQCVVVCCGVLWCAAVCYFVVTDVSRCAGLLTVCQYSSVLQFGAIRCNAQASRRCVKMAVCCSVLRCVAMRCSVLQCVAVCCSVLQGVASVLQCVAVCCGVLFCRQRRL